MNPPVLRHEETFRAARVSGALALPALATALQEAAGRHASELGCGLELLHARGVAWVLVRQRLELLRPLAADEELLLTTWPSGVYPLQVTREFVVASRGEVVARASTAWIVLDLATRRPVRPGELLDPALRPRLEPVSPISARLPAPSPGAVVHRFQVGEADIDLNRHVTNTSYLAWALGSVPDEVARAARPIEIEAHHLGEGLLGDELAAHASPVGDGAWAHAIVREPDGKELARARTRWAARSG